MKRHLIVRPAAEQDIAEAVDWYGKHASEQAARFLDELGSLMVRVGESPQVFRTVHGQVRRAGMRTFPYLVWFTLDESDTVQILAVTHHRRDPVTVRSRLDD